MRISDWSSDVCSSDLLIERLAHRPLLIDSSTIAPETARTLSSAAKAKGYAMLDAPVSGGPKGAREGTLRFMVGGDLEAFADADPVQIGRESCRERVWQYV